VSELRALVRLGWAILDPVLSRSRPLGHLALLETVVLVPAVAQAVAIEAEVP
jgi:hypothetical protein